MSAALRALLTVLGFAAVCVGGGVAAMLAMEGVSTLGAWGVCAAGLGAMAAAAWPTDNGIVIRRSR